MKKKVYKYSRAEIKQVFANLPIWRDEDYTPEDGLVFIDMLLALADKPKEECKHTWESETHHFGDSGEFVECMICGKIKTPTPKTSKPKKTHTPHKWSRKGNCPVCRVETGSYHSVYCSWYDDNKAYLKRPTPLKTKPETYLCPICKTEQLVNIGHECKPTPNQSFDNKLPEVPLYISSAILEMTGEPLDHAMAVKINDLISWANSVTKLLEGRK